MLSSATLRQLQALEAVERLGSVTAAAQWLHLTQPAISAAIKQLEAACGMALVEPRGRGIAVTEAGQAVTRAARAVLGEIESLGEELDALRGVRGGRLRLAAVSTAKYFVPHLLAQFNRFFPRIELQLRVANRQAVLDALSDAQADLVIMGTPPDRLACVSYPFADNPLSMVASVQHRLSRRRGLQLSELAGEPFLVRERGSGTRAAMERFFSEHALTPPGGIEIDSNETIKQAVMAGMGVSFLSLRTVRLEVATGKLAVLDVQGLPLMRKWYLVRLASRRGSPAVNEFWRFVAEQGAGLVDTVA